MINPTVCNWRNALCLPVTVGFFVPSQQVSRMLHDKAGRQSAARGGASPVVVGEMFTSCDPTVLISLVYFTC